MINQVGDQLEIPLIRRRRAEQIKILNNAGQANADGFWTMKKRVSRDSTKVAGKQCINVFTKW